MALIEESARLLHPSASPDSTWPSSAGSPRGTLTEHAVAHDRGSVAGVARTRFPAGSALTADEGLVVDIRPEAQRAAEGELPGAVADLGYMWVADLVGGYQAWHRWFAPAAEAPAVVGR